MAQSKAANRKPMQRIFMIASGLIFIGGLATNTLALYSSGQAEPVAESATDPSTTLAAQAEGFEIVLKREPENVTALEGLAQTRLQLNDPQGAIPPLEKLVSLHPDRPDYVAALNQARQKASDRTP